MLSLETSQCQVDSNMSATFYLEGYGVVIIKSNNVLSEIGGITRRQLKDFTGASLIFTIVGEVSDGCMYVSHVYVYTIIIITVHTQFHYNNIMHMSGSEKRDIFHTFVYCLRAVQSSFRNCDSTFRSRDIPSFIAMRGSIATYKDDTSGSPLRSP